MELIVSLSGVYQIALAFWCLFHLFPSHQFSHWAYLAAFVLQATGPRCMFLAIVNIQITSFSCGLFQPQRTSHLPVQLFEQISNGKLWENIYGIKWFQSSAAEKILAVTWRITIVLFLLINADKMWLWFWFYFSIHCCSLLISDPQYRNRMFNKQYSFMVPYFLSLSLKACFIYHWSLAKCGQF